MKRWVNFIMWLFKRNKKPVETDVKIPDPVEVSGVINGEAIPKGHIFPDVSRYRLMDYEKFKGKHLATKATESDNWVDPTFKINADECKKRGIQFYVYHFYRVEADPIKQAIHFLDTIKDYDVYTPLIVDYESANKQDRDDLKADLNDLKTFIKYVNKETDSKMIIYTGESLLNSLPFDSEFLEICGLPWVANYSREPKKFGIWNGMWAWQFSSNYKLDGIDHKDGGDANRFFN